MEFTRERREGIRRRLAYVREQLAGGGEVAQLYQEMAADIEMLVPLIARVDQLEETLVFNRENAAQHEKAMRERFDEDMRAARASTAQLVADIASATLLQPAKRPLVVELKFRDEKTVKRFVKACTAIRLGAEVA